MLPCARLRTRTPCSVLPAPGAAAGDVVGTVAVFTAGVPRA